MVVYQQLHLQRVSNRNGIASGGIRQSDHKSNVFRILPLWILIIPIQEHLLMRKFFIMRHITD
jgi:hypothetical protein